MGLFSGGKSSSKSTTTNQITYSDKSSTTSGTIGAASDSNIIAAGDVYGYGAKETGAIINDVTKTVANAMNNNAATTANAMKNAYKDAMSATSTNLKTSLNASNNMLSKTLQYVDKSSDSLKEIAGSAMSQVASAYSGANSAILQTQSDSAALFQQLKPFALYGMIAAIAYFVSKMRW